MKAAMMAIPLAAALAATAWAQDGDFGELQDFAERVVAAAERVVENPNSQTADGLVQVAMDLRDAVLRAVGHLRDDEDRCGEPGPGGRFGFDLEDLRKRAEEALRGGGHGGGGLEDLGPQIEERVRQALEGFGLRKDD